MKTRCDQVPNCRDESDERGCKILDLGEGYNKRVPPVGKNKEDELTPVPVKVSLTLLKIVNIKEEDYSIELQIQITLKWKEIRATYKNLRHQTYLNALSEDEIKNLWLPLVVYTNTDQQETTRLGFLTEWSTYVSVKREGSFTRSGYELVDETEIFKGNESTLIMRQSYTHEFQCIYHLERYPFDTQVKMAKLINILIPQKCSTEMNVLNVNQKSVTLLPSILKMNQALDMMLFVITEYELTNFTSAHGGIKMTIRMRRKILSEMMTTYFPSLLLMMITYATTHFKPFFFEAARAGLDEYPLPDPTRTFFLLPEPDPNYFSKSPSLGFFPAACFPADCFKPFKIILKFC